MGASDPAKGPLTTRIYDPTQPLDGNKFVPVLKLSKGAPPEEWEKFKELLQVTQNRPTDNHDAQAHLRNIMIT